MSMPTVAKYRTGRPRKGQVSAGITAQLPVAMDEPLREALKKFCHKEVLASEATAVRKILVERLRQEGFLTE